MKKCTDKNPAVDLGLQARCCLNKDTHPPLLVSMIAVSPATGEGTTSLTENVLWICCVAAKTGRCPRKGGGVLCLLHLRCDPLALKLDVAVTRAVSPSFHTEM